MLQKLAFIILVPFALTAQAATFDFVPATTGAEKEFHQLLSKGEHRQALLAWSSAHSGSQFGQSSNGVATYAYLLWQNGLPFTATQILTQNTQPSALHPELRKAWIQQLKEANFVQKGWITLSSAWANSADAITPQIRITKLQDVAKTLAAAKKISKEQANLKTRYLWSVATIAPILGDTKSALNAIAEIKAVNQTVIASDLISLTEARIRFQNGDFEGATRAYQEIPKSSSLWIDSVEERAWTHVRRDDHDKALGDITTLLMPALAPLTGAESYFLANYQALKICDYPRLFKNSELFKTRQRARLVEMQELASKGVNKNVLVALERFEKNGVSLDSAGPTFESIPRAALRDAYFQRMVETRRILLGEANKARELATTASALGGSQNFERLAQAAMNQAERHKPQAFQRLRTLAGREVQQFKVVLNKLHIIEAEVIERLHLDENLKGKRAPVVNVADQGNVLVFPQSGDEVWFDELDNYKARVKDCPTLKGASL